MSTEFTECPNCNTKLKGGLFTSVQILSDNKTKIINEYSEKKSTAYCSKCGNESYLQNRTKVDAERMELNNTIQRLLTQIPVISMQSPSNWEYEVLSMVTGQSTTGTGVISEFTSSITDVFGAQSGRYNKKLKAGEEVCFAQLRKQALDLGGNAVVATDIDYSEVGGEKGMLMVCMAGTAVNLLNTVVLGEKRASRIDELIKLNERIKYLYSFNTTEL